MLALENMQTQKTQDNQKKIEHITEEVDEFKKRKKA